MTDLIRTQIALLPDKPGVYQMKDENDKIIYIGKAKNLKKRVSQYFLRPQSGKVAAMVSHVHHFDIIVLSSDKEAFILEMNLIQTHYPRYNIMLMDDSHYPYIAIKKHGDAYLKIARDTKDQKYFYFGPFPNSGAAHETLNLLNKIFPTRKCKNMPNKACLYYSMGQCLAPCINKIEPEVYEKLYADIKTFLNGEVDEVRSSLRKKMLEASDNLEFETAGEYKKTLDALEAVTSKQRVEIVGDKTPRDVFAYAEREGYRSIAILTYRRGLLLGKHVHVVSSFGEVEEQMADLISQYYSNHETPKEIVSRIASLKDELEGLFEGVEVIYPQEGRLLDAVNLASLNARQGLDAHFMSARLEDDKLSLLEALGELLHIETPLRIELFDNSHLQGSSPVGAMVCFINGEPCKKMYRKFHLSEEDAGDDYGSMKEVTYRRYSRLKEENQSYPDLILVDGGITQIHATEEALNEAGVSINLFGLYKNDKHETEGLIDKDGNVYPLDNKSPLFFLLMRMQDEVHRFAITFHKDQRRKSMTKGILDDIKGLGAKRQEVVKMHYPTLESLKEASLSELNQILPEDVAKILFDKLSKI
ncbi:MAG: excinuclease ABC subunit UvrC [Bacilli bacterium]|nr:excinuclease ABC subunit UvrC [Bacilli bacterium]